MPSCLTFEHPPAHNLARVVDVAGVLEVVKVATLNYNGQKTGNPGVHFRYEIDLIERFTEDFEDLPDQYLLVPGKPIRDINQRTLRFLQQSFTQMKLVNDSDLACKEDTVEYDAAYFQCFKERVSQSLRRQLARASSQVAAYWYSAWVEAGRPEMKIRGDAAPEKMK